MISAQFPNEMKHRQALFRMVPVIGVTTMTWKFSEWPSVIAIHYVPYCCAIVCNIEDDQREPRGFARVFPQN